MPEPRDWPAAEAAGQSLTRFGLRGNQHIERSVEPGLIPRTPDLKLLLRIQGNGFECIIALGAGFEAQQNFATPEINGNKLRVDDLSRRL
jgi:hypothetical protein